MNIKLMFSDAIRSVGAPLKRFICRNKCITKQTGVKFQHNSEISNTEFEENAFVAHHASITNSSIGNHTSVGRYTKIREAEIGKYCSISWDCTIGAVAHPLNTISTSALTYRAEYKLISKDIAFVQKKVIIGNDVWIGCNVTIISGVTIGDGAVIGAGAVVTTDIPAYAICVGVPAKVIRYRINEGLISRLIDLEWWNWSHNDLKKNIHLFSEEFNEEILEQLEKYKEQNKRGEIDSTVSKN